MSSDWTTVVAWKLSDGVAVAADAVDVTVDAVEVDVTVVAFSAEVALNAATIDGEAADDATTVDGEARDAATSRGVVKVWFTEETSTTVLSASKHWHKDFRTPRGETNKCARSQVNYQSGVYILPNSQNLVGGKKSALKKRKKFSLSRE